MLFDKEVKEINPRLLCRTSSQPGESKLFVSVNRMCIERSFLDCEMRADGSQKA